MEDLFYLNALRKHKKRKFLWRKEAEKSLIDLESKIGSSIFGRKINGVRREFFNIAEDSWIWHEEYIDGKGKLHETTIRYEVQATKLIKVLPGPRYFEVEGIELENFHKAVSIYHREVLKNVYRK